MSSVSAGGQSNRRTIAIVLVVLAVLFAILGIIYATVSAGSLPSPLGHLKGSSGHHALRMTVSFVIAVVCLVAAWFVNRSGKSSVGNDSGSSTSVDAPSHG